MTLKWRLLSFVVLIAILSTVATSFVAVAQDEVDWTAVTCLTGVMCILPVVWLIIFILIAVWVYKDAEKRGMSGVLWLLIVIILGIIGLIIYLIVRSGHPIQPSQPPYPPQQPPYPPQQPPQ